MSDLIVVEYANQRILTTPQIAQYYETDTKHINDNFQGNKDRFTLSKHYFSLEGSELKKFKVDNPAVVGVVSRLNKLYLWTEKGAALHAKLLTTDKAWQFYETLVDEYYRLVREAPEGKLPVYFNKQTQDRCRMNEQFLPKGYWNVETEMVAQACTLQALQKELQHWCLPAGSGGIKWINHLKKTNHPLLPKCKKACLYVPNLKNRVEVWIYPYALLEYFRLWLRVEYSEYYAHEYSPSRLKGAEDQQINTPKKRGWLR
jgi:hypothetical protein